MFGFGHNFPGLMGGGTFQASYRAYPVSFIDKLDAENGDKVFLPPSALDRLASLQVEYPMAFKLEAKRSGRSTHCGVLEFVAEEGLVYMPYWMMQNLAVEEGDVVVLRNVSLRKGTYCKLQPHTTDFTRITDPKAVLERTLRGFSCLTEGDTICLSYNNRKYFIDIKECRPQNAISVVETDCEVDFAPPLDYVEPAPPPPKPPAPAAAAAAAASGSKAAEPQSQPEPGPPPRMAFVGSGRRLDGRPGLGGEPVPVKEERVGPRRLSPPPDPQAAKPRPAPGGPRAGKKINLGNRLLNKQAEEKEKASSSGAAAGSGAGAGPPAGTPNGTAAAAPGEDKKAEPPKPAAFQGKARSLRD